MTSLRSTAALRALAVAVVALLIASCSGDHHPLVYPVRGQVFYDGRPAANAVVIFHPLGEGGDWKTVGNPHATVGPDGSFALGTYSTDDGAPAGEYAVTVELWRAGGSGTAAEIELPATNRLPARYASPSASRLKATVSAGTNELPAFQLAR